MVDEVILYRIDNYGRPRYRIKLIKIIQNNDGPLVNWSSIPCMLVQLPVSQNPPEVGWRMEFKGDIKKYQSDYGFCRVRDVQYTSVPPGGI